MTPDPSPDPAGSLLISLETDVDVDRAAWVGAGVDLSTLCQQMASATFDYVQGLDEFEATDAESAEMAVRLTTDQELQALNRQYRDMDKPTNVLSFASLEGDSPARMAGMPLYLGDIAIASETVSREAGEQNKSIADHLAHMMVHGTLHLLGYDHEREAEAQMMETHERTILKMKGIDDPYQAMGLSS